MIFAIPILREINMNKLKFITILIIILALSSCKKTQTIYNDTYDTEFCQNKWIPAFISEQNATSIYFDYDLDTNEVWGKFIVDDALKFCQNLQKAFVLKLSEKKKDRLRNLGLITETSEVFNISYANSDWNLYLNSEKNEIYYYGKYK